MPEQPRTTAEALAAWDAGDNITSVEMGGIGDGYEQVLQSLAMEIIRAKLGEQIPEGCAMEVEAWAEDTTRDIVASDTRFDGVTGAMVGAAQHIAWRFLSDGYGPAIEKMRAFDPARLIQVRKVTQAAGAHERISDEVIVALVKRQAVLAEVRAERERQDKQWGGAAHDDAHDAGDWFSFRSKFEIRAMSSYAHMNPTIQRAALVAIAALAVAQIESFDRNTAGVG